MIAVDNLQIGVIKPKSKLVHWDPTSNKLIGKKNEFTIPIKISLHQPVNFMSAILLSSVQQSAGILISDGHQTQYVLLQGRVKHQVVLEAGTKNTEAGWERFKVELLSEHNSRLNRLYKVYSSFLMLLLHNYPELRTPFKSWFKDAHGGSVFTCEFNTHRDKVYHYHIIVENQRYPAVIGIPLRRIFKRLHQSMKVETHA